MRHFRTLSRNRMTATVFDTLAYAERLEAAGFAPEQAKGQAHALREIIDDQIATTHDMAALDSSISAKLAEMKADLIKWYLGSTFAMTALIVGLMKFIR